MTRRQAIAPGIRRDAYGYEVRWTDRGVPRTKRFPLDTPIETVKAWRKTKRTQATGRRERVGSFVREATRFLSKRRHLSSFKSDRAHLRPWIHRFGKLSRFVITREQVQDGIQNWAADGYSPRELRHRWRILSQFFTTIDPGGFNPTTGVKLPRIETAPKRRVPDATLTAVATQLYRQEVIGRLRDAKTRARFLVLATTGMRPAQLQRALPMDVLIDERLWVVQPAKGDKGSVVYMNDEILEATKLFITAKAWGDYDGRSFSRTLQRNGWPKGIRPYNMRHGVSQALKRGGAEVGDIQDHLGHRSPVTTNTFYLDPDLARLKATSARLDGRVGIPAFLPRATTQITKKQKAKDRVIAPQSAYGPIEASKHQMTRASAK